MGGGGGDAVGGFDVHEDLDDGWGGDGETEAVGEGGGEMEGKELARDEREKRTRLE